MGRYKFFYDFLWMWDRFCTNYFEALTEVKYLGNDDDKLLVPALFYLASEYRKLSVVREYLNASSPDPDPERDNPISRARNAIQMMELTLSLKKLQGHNYNIYEYCFLTISDSGMEAGLLCVAAFSLIAQISLLFILMYHNWGNITNVATWRSDCSTIIVVTMTTMFFARLAYAQCSDAIDFNAVFWKAGFPTTSTCINKVKMHLRNLLLGINILVNGFLSAMVVLFNIFFLLTSQNVNAAILNSLSLFFILEMDDALKPEWGDVKFDSHFIRNVYHSIASDDGDVQVEIIRFSDSEEFFASEREWMSFLERSDDKAHCILRNDDGQLVVFVYFTTRDKMTRDPKKIVQFHITGQNGKNLFENIKGFNCVQSDELAKVTLDELIKDIQARADEERNIDQEIDHEVQRQRKEERDRLKRQREDERDRIMTEVRSYYALEAEVLTPILHSDYPYCK